MNDLLLSYLPVTLLGAVLGLDVVSFPQAMLSRPIVAATLAGALLGSPQAGLLAGAVLELIAMETLPVGASRYPEWGTASVIGGAIYAARSADATSALPVACAAALFAAYASGMSLTWVRKLNARHVMRDRDAVEGGSYRAVARIQIGGLCFDLLRGGLLTFLGLLILDPVTRWLVATSVGDPATSRAVVVAIAASVAVSAVWRVFHSASHARWLFLTGLAVGTTLLVLGG